MIRLSTTLLEQFRRFVTYDYVTEESLIAQIIGKPLEPTWQMRAGATWDGLLVGDHVVQDGLAVWNGFAFQIMDVLKARDLIGPGLWQVKAVKTLQVGGCPVDLVAKVDHIHGSAITEVKTKWGSALGEYEHDLQWRAYLWVHGGTSVTYRMFLFREPDGGGFCELRAHATTSFWPYAGLEQTLALWTGRLLDWAHTRRLTEYLHREEMNR